MRKIYDMSPRRSRFECGRLPWDLPDTYGDVREPVKAKAELQPVYNLYWNPFCTNDQPLTAEQAKVLREIKLQCHS